MAAAGEGRGCAIAIVGVGAILPDAPDACAFWENVKSGRYSISDVTPDRWDPEQYYHPDPAAPDKTYSRIGGFVREWSWDPMAWKLPIPPRVSEAMDDAQKWAVACARAALNDACFPERPLDLERTAVVLGNAMGGEKHYLTALRIYFPEFGAALESAPSFASLPPDVRHTIEEEARERFAARLPAISEDTMPGELANCLAGRVSNLFNLRGPNYVCDAACASAMAAIDAAAEGLMQGDYDAVLCGGIDRNMGASTYVKFCKIGALSATGTRPYADGADGFVMGEGAALFLLKRVEDAERAGDRIYAVLRGIGGASDGRGKGITAPNPVGQRLAIERAWKSAGLVPTPGVLVEGHGTSTRVGDVVEVQSLAEAFAGTSLPPGSIALGSVKSNIGHLKGAAGAAGLLKAVFALHEKLLPPSLHCGTPNPAIDFAHLPIRVNSELRPWERPADGVRRAGVSAFGFGGTNFHLVLEEYVPGQIAGAHRTTVSVPADTAPRKGAVAAAARDPGQAVPRGALRGGLLVGAETPAALAERLEAVRREAEAGRAPVPQPPAEADLRAPERIALAFGDAAQLAERADRAGKALQKDAAAAWRALRAQGVFRGRGPAPKVAFLYTGQGSQYPNMLARLRLSDPIVRGTFEEADRVMTPILGRSLSSYVFVEAENRAALTQAEEDLRQTAITQPVVLTVDTALTRLLAAHGVRPDFVMGHSLGEYGALVASGALPLEDAIEAVAARGREMANLEVPDPGWLAAVFAPAEEVERALAALGSGVVIANHNSRSQVVIGGPSAAVAAAMEGLTRTGHEVVRLPVSHAFHTSIVAPASEPLRRVLSRLHLAPPRIPLVANVTGELYPTGPDAVPQMLDLLSRQVASPVLFAKGLRTLHTLGARLFIEVGPKKALHGFVEDVFADDPEVVALFTNHPKNGELESFDLALCGCWAAGLGTGRPTETAVAEVRSELARAVASSVPAGPPASGDDRLLALGRLFAEFLDRGLEVWRGKGGRDDGAPVVVTGAALGLPAGEHVFGDANVARILHGEQMIDVIPQRHRHAIVEKNITRLMKSEAGGPTFETIESAAEVIKLAARAGQLDLAGEFGVPADRVPALDVTTRLAIAAGLDALRDAGIPLSMHYRTTSKATRLPDRWMLPEGLRDETGVIFAAAFPGFDAFADELDHYHEHRARAASLADFEALRARIVETGTGHGVILEEVDRRIHELRAQLEAHPYAFDRRFLFRVLAMGHSQFAELIGARGPNTHLNAACASTTQAVAVAEDWIRSGRCRRVVVLAADDVTSEHLLPWMGAGFLSTGAAATDELVEEAALPFDRRRHGMILGMGAAAIVIESAEAARERGLDPICEVLAAETANSAFHGTRLDVEHIGAVMERVIAHAELRGGVRRAEIAPHLVFVSHETYTPARGGSAAAEVQALRRVFGQRAAEILIANTKGFTGHPMGVGIEDVVAIKALETGVVPPVPNYRDEDPELGPLHLSRGGAYDPEYALRLGAGFGSQISMTLLRRVPARDGARRAPDALGYAYRVADPAAFDAWLRRSSGLASVELETVKRTLRLRDAGLPALATASPAPAVATLPTPRPPPPTAAPAVVMPQPEPAAAPPSTPASPPVVTSVASDDLVRARVLELVAEKTGYPIDMLDLDLDLEADLGIDTVKQAETFAAIRECYGIPRDEKLRLRDFPTLAHVIGFVRDRRPDLAPPPAPTPATPPAPPAGSDDPVRARVLELVAEKTGYPIDMLDLDLDLEADLGIDTVKQAETFAAIRECYGIPRDEKLRLRDFPTLAHVIGFVRDRRPDLAASSATARAGAAPDAMDSAATEPAGEMVNSDKMPRRVVTAVPRPPLDGFRPTGVRIDAGSRFVVAADRGGVGTALAASLLQRGAEVLVVDDAPSAAELTERLRAFSLAGAVQGVYWLPALDPDLGSAAPELAVWRESLRIRAKLLYATMRALVGDPSAPAPFLLSAVRLGGRFGYDAAGATHPLGGAVAGFTKAYRREFPGTLAKVVDHGSGVEPLTLADRLLAETERDPGAVEVGYAEGGRWSVGWRGEPAGHAGVTLGRESVLVVSGAAGSIVSAIVADLAAASGGTFHLLDRVSAPDPADPDLARFEKDRDGLRRDLFERMRARGERATPARVEREVAELERAHAALQAIRAVEAAGGRAHWHAVDLCDGESVAKVIGEVCAEHARIDVLLHAAGLEVSRRLADKEPAEFDRVFDVKSDGWFNLLHGLGSTSIGVTVVFGSIAGRFGNAGQTDYAAANDLLCKLTSALRSSRPSTQGVALDWTAWSTIGMASRGSIPQIMEQAGIDMLAPEIAVPIVRREIVSGASEILVAGRLGVLAEPWAPAGGAAETLDALHVGPLVRRVTGVDADGTLEAEVLLDPAVQPFLYDHRIDGTPVLPGVMGIELFAEVAALLRPEWSVVAVEGVEFLAPFKFYRDESRAIRVRARPYAEGDELRVDCELVGERRLVGQEEARTTVHFTGSVRLASRPVAFSPGLGSVHAPGVPSTAFAGRDAIYRLYFHGPAYRVLDRVWRDGAAAVGVLAADLPANHAPASAPLRTAPRLLELCLQTAGVQELEGGRGMALPERIARVRFSTDGEPETGARFAVVRKDGRGGFDAAVVDETGREWVRLEGYGTVSVPAAPDADAVAALRAALG